MGFSRMIAALLLTAAIGLTVIGSKTLVLLGVSDFGWSWMGSYLFPKGLILLLSLGLTFVLWPIVQRMKPLRVLGVLLTLGIPIGSYCIVNVPYVNDWAGQGTDMVSEAGGDSIEEHLGRTDPEFDGIICLALPGCPYCIEAMPGLELMKERIPDLDVMIFLFTADSSKVEAFKLAAGVDNLPFRPVPDPSSSMELTEGAFPTFLYFKGGKIVYRWFNDQFGYPAKDRVENRLQ